MTNAYVWEIELSGSGLWDGARTTIPRDTHFPPDRYYLPVAKPVSLRLASTGPYPGDPFDRLEFELHHRTEDGVFVYRLRRAGKK